MFLKVLGNWEEGQPSNLPPTLQKEKFPDFFFSFLEKNTLGLVMPWPGLTPFLNISSSSIPMKS